MVDLERRVSGARLCWPLNRLFCVARDQRALTVRILDDPIVLCLAATVIGSLLFLAFPQADLAASALFHRGADGFELSRHTALKALRKSADLVLIALVVGLLLRLGWGCARRGFAALEGAPRTTCLLAALALGPGLVVNGVFKSHWGRPRPVMVDLFGGEAPYQPVWRISDWCQSNCSFVSGEGSTAAWIVAALVLVPGRLRPFAAAPVILYALAISLNRLAFGGHFLSDIILSWTISGLIFAVLFRLMVKVQRLAPVPDATAWSAAHDAA